VLKKHKDSHLDHSLTEDQIQWILDSFKDRDGFLLETVTLPQELGQVPCGLYGPLMGDDPISETEVIHERRGSRSYDSRLVNRPVRPTSQVTVIAGEHDGESCVLFTAFGGPATPREPGDPSLPEKGRTESVEFWSTHALAR
jgi:hypothetical protein